MEICNFDIWYDLLLLILFTPMNQKTHNTMINKRFYEAPEAEILAIKFERNFCETETDVWTPGGAGSYNGDKENDLGSY